MFIMILMLLAQRGMYDCYLSSYDNNPCNRGWGVLGLPCEVANYLSLILSGRIAIVSGIRWHNMQLSFIHYHYYYYVSASTSSTLILSGPLTPVAVGDQADYVCTLNNKNGDIQWIINSMPLEDLNLPNVQTTSLTGRGFLLFNDLSVNFNETTVQCRVNNSGTVIYSNINKLLVQGMPQAYACQSILLALLH